MNNHLYSHSHQWAGSKLTCSAFHFDCGMKPRTQREPMQTHKEHTYFLQKDPIRLAGFNQTYVLPSFLNMSGHHNFQLIYFPICLILRKNSTGLQFLHLDYHRIPIVLWRTLNSKLKQIQHSVIVILKTDINIQENSVHTVTRVQ